MTDTHVIADVVEGFGELSEAGRAVLAPFLIPPAAAGSWLDERESDGAGGGAIDWETAVSPSGRVKVWSQTRYPGDSATAATIAGAVDGIRDELVGLMEREPLPDGDVSDPNGGDAKFDIYIVRIKYPGETHVYPTGFSCSEPNPAYVLIDGRETECLLPTVAHELMHAIQWSYVGKGGCIHGQGVAGPGYGWWMEASATWAEEYVFRRDENQCEHPFAFDFLSRPELPLEFSGRPYDPYHRHPYGAYLWPLFLERSSGSADYVRTIWENCTVFPTALEAIDESLPDGFRRWWPEFALYNWNDHPEFNYQHDDLDRRAACADPATGEFGACFNAVELDGELEVEIPLSVKVQHLSSLYYHFTFDDETVREVTFQHFFDAVAHPTARVQAMIRTAGHFDFTYEDWTETPLKRYCRDRAGQELSELVIIFTNSEWKDRTHVLDPADDPVLIARDACSVGGSWSGTITNVRTEDEDTVATLLDGTVVITRIHNRFEQRWEITPRVIGSIPHGDCESEVVVEATWSGFNSVDEYRHVRGSCGLWTGCDDCTGFSTNTQVDRVESPGLPSAFLVNYRCGSTYHLHRAPGWVEAGLASKPTGYRYVTCRGDVFFDLPPLELAEWWSRSRLIFEVEDLSKPETFKGEEIDRREVDPPPLAEGVVVYCETWTWELTREPD